MSVASPRPSSAPSPDAPRGEGQSRESQFLSVNSGLGRGGLNANTFGHQPTNSSSGSSQNDSSYITVSQNQPTIEISAEHNHDRSHNPETASGAPSSGGSSENDPWIRKNLLTLGKLPVTRYLVASEMTKTVCRRWRCPRLLKPANTPRRNARNSPLRAGRTKSS